MYDVENFDVTSKECLYYIAEEKGLCDITGAIEYNWKLYPDFIEKIEFDLVKLEKLEKVIYIFKRYTFQFTQELIEEDYKLLKEVLK